MWLLIVSDGNRCDRWLLLGDNWLPLLFLFLSFLFNFSLIFPHLLGLFLLFLVNSVHLKLLQLLGHVVLVSHLVLQRLIFAHQLLHLLFHRGDLLLSSNNLLVFEFFLLLLLLIVFVDIGFLEIVSHLLGLALSVCLWLCLGSFFLGVGGIG